MKVSKIRTNRKQAHTPKSPKGMGDYYGTGIKQKIGRIREDFIVTPQAKDLKKPPKSLA